MSDKPEITLATLFRLKDDAAALQQGLEDRGSAAVRAAIESVPPPFRRAAVTSLAGTLDWALRQKDLLAILAKAWNLRRDLQKFCDQSKYPPGSISDYDLKENTVEVALAPSVQLELDGAKIGPVVKFDVEMKLVSAPVLKIRNARIIAACVGKLHAEGAIKCEGFVLADRSGETFDFREELPFGEGFAIGKPRGA